MDNIFQADQCDAFDSNVDEAPTVQTMFMTNLSFVNLIYDEADHDYYIDNVVEYQEVHEMQNNVQPNNVVDSDAEYTSDSNIIPYEDYVKDNADQVVPSNVSSMPNDSLMMIINDMHEQAVQCVFANEQSKVVNATLTAELPRYNEQVELFLRTTTFFCYAMFIYSFYLSYVLSLYPFIERYAQPYFFSCLIRQMVNTRTDADLSAAVQNALQTLLPYEFARSSVRVPDRQMLRVWKGSGEVRVHSMAVGKGMDEQYFWAGIMGIRDCTAGVAPNTQRALVGNQSGVFYYECGRMGHYRKDYPKLRNQNCGNKTRNNESTAKAYAIGGRGANPDSNIVIETNVILRGCTLRSLGHPFDIDLMPVELGSFDIIISMDCLAKYYVVIVCDEKIVRIPYGDEVLIIRGDDCDIKSKSKLNIISYTKTQKYIQKGSQVYLEQVTSKKADDKSEEERLEDVPIV
nr:reverse transcriptase domain-containing protein [Tanacetum cinerariifolium]